VSVTDEILGASQLLEGTCPGCFPQSLRLCVEVCISPLLGKTSERVLYMLVYMMLHVFRQTFQKWRKRFTEN